MKGFVFPAYKNNRDIGKGRVGFDTPADLDSINIRHVYIQQNEVWRLGLNSQKSKFTVQGGSRFVPFHFEQGR